MCAFFSQQDITVQNIARDTYTDIDIDIDTEWHQQEIRIHRVIINWKNGQ